MEQKIGRPLTDQEEVDHIDDNPRNNVIDNFQILTGRKNKEKTTQYAKYTDFDCPACGTSFMIRRKDYQSNQVNRGKAGPYCSRRCAGKMHN